MSLRSKLYFFAKILGDISAVRHHRVMKRIKNRLIYRTLGKVGRRLTR